MPIGGTRKQIGMGQSYIKSPNYTFAQYYDKLRKDVLNESVDLYDEPKKAYRRVTTKSILENAFLQDLYDPMLIETGCMAPEEADDIVSEMRELFENDIEALMEHTAASEYNPVIGMSPFVHKNIMMNMVWEQAITKVTAVAPSFSMGIQYRYLITPSGEKIDMFVDQNKIGPAMMESVAHKEIEITLPELGTTDIVALLGGGALDALAVDTKICAVHIKDVFIQSGDLLPDSNGYLDPDTSETATADGSYDCWFRLDLPFTPTYGNAYDRISINPVTIKYKKASSSDPAGFTIEEITDTISATLKDNRFEISSLSQKIEKIRLFAKLDTSNAMQAHCSVKWGHTSTHVDIPNAEGLSTTISPQELKDFAALYNVNQLTEIMDMYNKVLSESRDYKIKHFLDSDYKTLDPRTKVYDEYDWAVREGYHGDHVEWRRATFLDRFDQFVTKMLQIYNDPNMVISAIADPDICRRITPVEVTYTAPSSIGPLELDFHKTITTSDKRVYNWLGSDKLRNDPMVRVLINPRNTERCIYRFYEYQLFISNDIRNSANPALNNVYAYDRNLIMGYQKVQGRMKILNRSGIKNDPFYPN